MVRLDFGTHDCITVCIYENVILFLIARHVWVHVTLTHVPGVLVDFFIFNAITMKKNKCLHTNQDSSLIKVTQDEMS